ncbi:hypothetical protein EC991_005946 [Linnemannia zychae]|nr:hypothetical protein EC991_005946 [Linnemannia zychae]
MIYYRKLLNCVITEVETASLLDLTLVQGLVQLVESASSDYLEPDAFFRILIVLSTRLQSTRKQPTKHQYYLIWALSRMLDVMVEGKVKDLQRVDQEPLLALFNQMKASEDPFLKHQATYAFQGLMHVLNNETCWQCMPRWSSGRQVWYTSLREAQQHIHNGRLQTFKNLVFESPCRDHDDFQWGICRLLGNIAIDSLWETRTRKHAVDFLSELYRNKSIWTSSEYISRWILSILRMIVVEDTAISNHALLRLHGLKNARLPIPASSTLLSRVLDIPTVEYDLHRLKDRRLKEQENALYIQPQAKPSLQASDGTLFPLLEKVLEFLTGPGLVFLLLGDSGGGKSTFNLQLERTLWKSYKYGDTIPLHIDLPSIDNPQQDMIAKQLGHLGFTDTQIIELKKNREFIVICDGYDESQLTTNIHSSNHFNKPGQWKVKMIVTCRTQYLGSDYRNRFIPQGVSAYDRSAPDLFQEAVIAPFTKEQIQRYVNIYVPLEPRTWSTEDYMDKLIAIPNLLDLALPEVTKGKHDLTTIEVTRVLLYDVFVQQWLEVNQRRLERNGALSSADRDMLVQLIEADFVSMSMNYSTNLAQAIFYEQDGNPVVQYVHLNDKSTWKAKFFGSQAEVRLLRDSSPLTRTGNYFRFIHRSMLEYFFSRAIYSPNKNDEEFDPQVETVLRSPLVLHTNSPLFQKDLLQEPSVISFLCDRVKLNPLFKHQLRAAIELSKTDATATIAATNAITILVRASINFNGADLRGVKVPGADLSGGQFDSAQFQGSDLKGLAAAGRHE